MAIIDHDFNNGLTVRNGTIVADYEKFYQNVYPAQRHASVARVNPADTFFNLAAYNHQTDRNNFFNQTDFIYKTWVGAFHHTLGIRHRVRPADRRRHPQYRRFPERHADRHQHHYDQSVRARPISGR